jgi:hypothetical protein
MRPNYFLSFFFRLGILSMLATGVGCSSADQPDGQGSQKQEDEMSTEMIENPTTAGTDQQAANAKKAKLPAFGFEKKEHDFGQVAAGEKVSYVFTFTNEGSKPLLINQAQASCGCTVPRYPQQPIGPGESGEIEVIFDSAGKQAGEFRKTVTIKANTMPSLQRLFITGTIVSNNP